MANITISIDEALLKAGRKYAEKHQTSINGLIRKLLEETVEPEPRAGDVADVEHQPAERHDQRQRVAEARQHPVAEFLRAQSRHADHPPDVELDRDVDQHRDQDRERKRRAELRGELRRLRDEPRADRARRHQEHGTEQRDSRRPGWLLGLHRVSAIETGSLGHAGHRTQPRHLTPRPAAVTNDTGRHLAARRRCTDESHRKDRARTARDRRECGHVPSRLEAKKNEPDLRSGSSVSRSDATGVVGSVEQLLRDVAAVVGDLLQDGLVEPHVHLGRVAHLLRRAA